MTPSLPLDRGWSHSPIVLRFLFSLLLLLLSGLPLIDAESVGAQDVSATLQDSLQTDNDMNNKADAGDTFRYTLVISNTDVMDASGVIADITLDANLMFLPGSIHSTPISRKDIYTLLLALCGHKLRNRAYTPGTDQGPLQAGMEGGSEGGTISTRNQSP